MAASVNTQPFDPAMHQQGPARALTLVLRGLRLGERVVLPDGTLVRSVSVPNGSSQERRFAVVPPEDSSSAVDRHRVMALGHDTFRTASEAAMRALKKEN